MKSLARLLMLPFTMVFPVAIAACYGMAYEFSYHGRVVDKRTGRGIAGLKVTCVTASGESMTKMTIGGTNGRDALPARPTAVAADATDTGRTSDDGDVDATASADANGLPGDADVGFDGGAVAPEETGDPPANDVDGLFHFNSNVECNALQVEDVDGEANGGTYAPVKFETSSSQSNITIEVTRQ